MLTIREKIKNALSGKLPGIESHKKMIPKGRSLRPTKGDTKKIKQSSVMMLLYPNENELNVCLIVRPAHMKHHARQIALPGGKMEKHETAIETAFRETQEEIGIQKQEIEILGSLTDIYIEVSHFIIHPFVGWMSSTPQFTIDANEVEEAFHFPLMRYKNVIESVDLETITGKMSVPCIFYKEKIIWGATAMILSEFYDAVDTIPTLS